MAKRTTTKKKATTKKATKSRTKKPPAKQELIGPITRAAFGGKEGPPPIIEEWLTSLKQKGEHVLVWAGAIAKADHTGGKYADHISWGWLKTDVGAGPRGRKSKEGPPPWTNDDIGAKVERMLSPLAHESRIRLLQAMRESSCSSADLSKATGLKGGNLHHHLKELIYSGYVRDKGRAYDISSLGLQLLCTLTWMADHIVHDRGDDLVTVGSW